MSCCDSVLIFLAGVTMSSLSSKRAVVLTARLPQMTLRDEQALSLLQSRYWHFVASVDTWFPRSSLGDLVGWAEYGTAAGPRTLNAMLLRIEPLLGVNIDEAALLSVGGWPAELARGACVARTCTAADDRHRVFSRSP